MMPAKNTDDRVSQREERIEAEFTDVQAPSVSGEHPHPPHKREHARYKVELDVSLGSDHNFYVGFVENISAGGVFVATHMLKPVGEILELSIHIPNSDSMITGTGEVRWIREFSERSNVPPGMGVRFINLEPGSVEAIERFLARREPIFFDED
jgi:uncharacterized protein (TIGR02266 family)